MCADTLTPAERSERMSLIRSRNTKTELVVRRLVHAMGYRYRLHDRRIPGSPDMVFRPRKKAIFIHGCFWHGHVCKLGRMPKSRLDFWSKKIGANRDRDERVLTELKAIGWKALVIWECELSDHDRISRRVQSFLDA